MQVATLAVQHLFEQNVLYRVPLYQRPYVWNEDGQWRPMWDDISRLADQVMAGEKPRAHFLGATVQGKEIVAPGQMESRLLIDGQQRMTTLQLLLRAFHDLVAVAGLTDYASALAMLYRNSHALNTKLHQSFKVYPTNADRADFHIVMTSESRAALLKACGAKPGMATGRTIIDGYLFFAREIEAWLGPDDAEMKARAAALYGAVRDEVRLVVIDVDEKDDAQLIFETLNARGTPLLAADLVKNALLSAVERAGSNVEQAYETYWAPFDNDSYFWRGQTGRGHARRARIEQFLQFALTIMSRREVAAGHLYAAYRDFAARPDAPTAPAQMERLRRYGDIYRRLVEGHHPPRVQLFLRRLAVMDFESSYPFLIKLFDLLDDNGEALERVLVDLESFLVRRMVARLDTRGYNKLFADLLFALDVEPDAAPDAVRERLQSGEAEVDRWPDDQEFRRGWSDNPLYENLTRPRLRLLLEAMEAALQQGGYAEVDGVPSSLTIEHVLPRSWQEHWSLPSGVDPIEAEERRNRALHTIGNLTLLKGALNAMQSNRPWIGGDAPGKRDGLAAHTVLHLNKKLLEQERWDEEAIAVRAGELFLLARQTWPRPTV
ncbi:DUF262 domain-containing protein [Sphingomonas lenta]|uniref:DUF262 domain-containing protein n=1 Tax=Sphingomonas lenta TaxID=1141887 RepID=A0A2A2SDM8_9SPHN|nr:DUF262 domain-containing protein [Sphingomonas lenta]PAX07300.1 hypothetical protein CKY28_14875 [Sphingomonas lenta]